MIQKQGRRWISAAMISAFSLTGGCREEPRQEAYTSAGHTNPKDEKPVRSLLQLIARPDEYGGKRVDLGAYIVLDSEHKAVFVEYGLNNGEETYIIDSSPIGFELNSFACQKGPKKASVLAENDILRIFSARKAAYGFLQGTFESDTSPFDGGRICDVTGMRLLPNSVREEKE